MSQNEKDPAKGLNAAVASVLNGERTMAGLTFDALADESGISKRDLIRKLSTKERHIDVATLERLSDVFRTTPGQVIAAAQELMARPLADRIRGQLPETVKKIDNEGVTGGADAG